MFEIEATSTGATNILVGLRERMARLEDLTPELTQATVLVYEATRSWYDSRGDGTWPPLAESTVQRKASQGYAEPERPLYAEGNLYESATSPSGPYSYKAFPGINGVVIGVDWAEDGWQIPVVHFYGTDTAGPAHNTRIPARPIWPAPESIEAITLRQEIATLLMRGI